MKPILDREYDKLGFYLLIILFSLCYTALRFELNIEYRSATWEQLYNLTAPIPFGYRILVPLLSRPLVLTGLDISTAYMFWEVISAFLLLHFVYLLISCFLPDKWSRVLTLQLVFILPFLYLFNLKWPLYYPYDTFAMLFVVAGIYYLQQKCWVPALLVTILATLNRESSILVPMMFAAMYVDKLHYRKYLLILGSMILSYFTVRFMLYYLTLDNPRPYIGSLAFIKGSNWRFSSNIYWVRDPNNMLVFLSTMAFFPVLLYAFKRNLPAGMHRWLYVSLVYFSMLFFIGNLYEPRIFGEIIVIMYIPLGIAVHNYLVNTAEQQKLQSGYVNSLTGKSSIVFFIDKYFIYILIFTVITVTFLLGWLGVTFFYPDL